MSVNKEYGESMDNGVKDLLEHRNFDKATNHVTFSAENLELPEGVTEESLNQHIGLINDLSAQVEVATRHVAFEAYENNKDLTTIDGTLSLGGMTINSQFHLKQQVGEEHIYGASTTAVDYVHAPEQAEWLGTQRTAGQELAAKLFG